MKNPLKTASVKAQDKSVINKEVVDHSDAIRERAYHIFLNSGSLDEHDNWMQAEKIHNVMM